MDRRRLFSSIENAGPSFTSTPISKDAPKPTLALSVIRHRPNAPTLNTPGPTLDFSTIHEVISIDDDTPEVARNSVRSNGSTAEGVVCGSAESKKVATPTNDRFVVPKLPTFRAPLTSANGKSDPPSPMHRSRSIIEPSDDDDEKENWYGLSEQAKRERRQRKQRMGRRALPTRRPPLQKYGNTIVMESDSDQGDVSMRSVGEEHQASEPPESFPSLRIAESEPTDSVSSLKQHQIIMSSDDEDFGEVSKKHENKPQVVSLITDDEDENDKSQHEQRKRSKGNDVDVDNDRMDNSGRFDEDNGGMKWSKHGEDDMDHSGHYGKENRKSVGCDKKNDSFDHHGECKRNSGLFVSSNGTLNKSKQSDEDNHAMDSSDRPGKENADSEKHGEYNGSRFEGMDSAEQIATDEAIARQLQEQENEGMAMDDFQNHSSGPSPPASFHTVPASDSDDSEIQVLDVKKKHNWNSSVTSNEANSDDEVTVISITDSPPKKAPTPVKKQVLKRPVPVIVPPPQVSLNDYNRLISNDPTKRNFAGKMTAGRYEDIRDQTNNLIASMHKALSTAPDENVLAENPQGLKIDLMHHQKQGLAWLLWRETQKPGSGILADDMGLGKTLSMISLILEQKNKRLADKNWEKERDERRNVCRHRNLVYSNATLVVAPASLILQWQKEVEDRVALGKLTVHVYHGSKRKASATLIAGYDIVITTYGTLASDVPLDNNSNSVLGRIAWERIILDEAHKIKNRKAKVSKIACQLSAIHRWCLTGTPIQNELWDLFSLIRFMKIHPFHEEGHWKMYIMSGSKNNERLNTLIKGLLLRRTKDQTQPITNKPILTLPKRTFEVIELEMKGAEGRCYQLMFEASRQKVKQMIQDSQNEGYHIKKKEKTKIINPFLGGNREIDTGDHFQIMSCLLALLLRLRQACVHLSLTKNAVDVDCFKNEDVATPDEDDLAELEKTFSAITLEQDEELGQDVVAVERLFEPEAASTKVRAVLHHLKEVIDRGDKVVIVSQWTSVLDIIQHHLSVENVPVMSITGSMKPIDRQQVMNDFNSFKNAIPVLLLSLTAGGVGLNLVGGNHLFMVDLHWNPAQEQQAFDRIYRMGQKKEVFVKKFICKGTIEQRVLELQEKKIMLAKSVLDGVAQKNLTKLTMNDLKYLFELDKRGHELPPPPQPFSQVNSQVPRSYAPAVSKPLPSSTKPTLKRPLPTHFGGSAVGGLRR
ncbi:unnamed protein product [Bursaphelenchus okinawaensis]|uniref:Transcription termination factor 2 n=1 Tax=Bursaphelenchus okinawaensis TaxID=465554 RepID=A0A811LS86_9BILA|nr:unnamed protein product [Bursaphelenchus okinawaensis]CAG9127640.1 unnamed protein product [Bursaphelenchus okinawaensis]